MTVKGTCLFAVVWVASLGQAAASDPATTFLDHLFLDACIANTGKPENVRAFAEQHHMSPVMKQPWLDMFAGPGDGAAWLLSAREGKFALSLRGLSHACAVWAPQADTKQAESDFLSLVETVRKTTAGESRLIKDDTVKTPAGDARALVYGVAKPGSKGVVLFTLLTAQKPNAAFQVSMQEAVAANPSQMP